MRRLFVLNIYVLVLLSACGLGVIYSPFDKVLSMWIAGALFIVLGLVGAWILREKLGNSAVANDGTAASDGTGTGSVIKCDPDNPVGDVNE